MKTAYILYENYLTSDGCRMSLGGIQTYIANLIPIVQQYGYKVHIYQHSLKDFDVDWNGLHISGISQGKTVVEMKKAFKKRLLKEINKDADLLIFGCESFAFDSREYKSIAIQHGISWDKPCYHASTKQKIIIGHLRKIKLAWSTIHRVSKVKMLVCVDYNFVNWYRALTVYPFVRMQVIPNFTQIPPTIPIKPEGKVNIIFARRFYEYRGTHIFAEAIKPLLNERNDIAITIAGEGPDENYLHSELGGYPQVSFIKYSSEDSLDIHADKHIAVIPTLGSEGTSLSLLEAMASGCTVICTNVGGMTNIVLDHYNGIMINPKAEELNSALRNVLDDDILRNRLAQKAYETASMAFSLKNWQQSWKKIINEIVK